jgi:hypothetical protein
MVFYTDNIGWQDPTWGCAPFSAAFFIYHTAEDVAQLHVKVDLVTDATYQGELLRQKLAMEAEKQQPMTRKAIARWTMTRPVAATRNCSLRRMFVVTVSIAYLSSSSRAPWFRECTRRILMMF